MINSAWELKECQMEGMGMERGVQGNALAQPKDTAIFKSRKRTGGMWRKASGWAEEGFCGWNR